MVNGKCTAQFQSQIEAGHNTVKGVNIKMHQRFTKNEVISWQNKLQR